MGGLTPIAFDIETSGFGPEAVTTVAGLAHEMGEIMLLNTDDRDANCAKLERALKEHSAGSINLTVTHNEQELLSKLKDICHERLDDDRHYLTAYHGETWNGGFDLPFLRTACINHTIEWPFANLAYADVLPLIDRFNTNDSSDLVGVYEELIGGDSCDPFDNSKEAVSAFDDARWEPLLLHNLADIQRTRALAVLASEYVPQSDFQMKNLSPPSL
jgi:uncharacterized protein YprB with RNaseH-like and TPR domain